MVSTASTARGVDSLGLGELANEPVLCWCFCTRNVRYRPARCVMLPRLY